MKLESAGWLPKDDSLSWIINGVEVSPATRTRREEYHWVLSNILPTASTVLDAATGYVDTWHMLPYILRNAGYEITTCDFNESTLKMPPMEGITREVADITNLPYSDNSFDVVCCISTIEHLTRPDKNAVASELIRVARHQILVTADLLPNLPGLFGLPVDINPSPANATQPAVYAADIRK